MKKEDFKIFVSKAVPGFRFDEPLKSQMSSVDLVNFMILLETEYKIEIFPTDFAEDKLASWESFYDLVKERTAAG